MLHQILDRLPMIVILWFVALSIDRLRAETEDYILTAIKERVAIDTYKLIIPFRSQQCLEWLP